MAQYIKQANIFGRIGSGVGKGLAEQLPKEIERGRLAAGLKQFEQDSGNLNPIQQLARLSSIPGITPQMIQSFHELAKYQNQANAYNKAAQDAYGRGAPGAPGAAGGQEAPDIAASPQNPPGAPSDINVRNVAGAAQAGMPMQSPMAAMAATSAAQPVTPNVPREERKPAQITSEPPLADRTLPRTPWTPGQRNQRVSHYINQGFLADQAKQLAADDEARYREEPEVYEQRLNKLEEKQGKARSELDRQLSTRLQKSGEGIYKDITGDQLINIQRGMERDLVSDPHLSYTDAANDWSNRALNFAKAKTQLNNMSATTGIESWLKGNQNLNKLKEYADIYKRADQSEELYNTLQIKNTPAVTDDKGNVIEPAKTGLGLSPQGAARIAYPLTEPVKKYLGNFKPVPFMYGKTGPVPDYGRIYENSKKAAIDLEGVLDADDSILAIARALYEKDPSFDQSAFFDQLREDKDKIRLNDRQRRELGAGEPDFLPHWGDLLIFPWFRR